MSNNQYVYVKTVESFKDGYYWFKISEFSLGMIVLYNDGSFFQIGVRYGKTRADILNNWPYAMIINSPIEHPPVYSSTDNERIEKLEEDVRYWKQTAQMNLRTANGLYDTILRNLKPYFPSDTRDLDWDVIPSTIGEMARQHRELTAYKMVHGGINSQKPKNPWIKTSDRLPTIDDIDDNAEVWVMTHYFPKPIKMVWRLVDVEHFTHWMTPEPNPAPPTQ